MEDPHGMSISSESLKPYQNVLTALEEEWERSLWIQAGESWPLDITGHRRESRDALRELVQEHSATFHQIVTTIRDLADASQSMQKPMHFCTPAGMHESAQPCTLQINHAPSVKNYLEALDLKSMSGPLNSGLPSSI